MIGQIFLRIKYSMNMNKGRIEIFLFLSDFYHFLGGLCLEMIFK